MKIFGKEAITYFRYFYQMLINPKETTAKILEERFEWKHIFLVLLILSFVNSILGILSFAPIYIAGLSQIFLAIAVILTIIFGIVFGTIFSIIYYFILILLFYISAYLLGLRGKLKELSSVLAFAFIILLLMSFLFGILNSILTLTGKLSLWAYYTTPGILITLPAFLIYVYFFYVAHFPIKQIYNTSKKRALMASYMVFIVLTLYAVMNIVVVSIITDPKTWQLLIGEDNYYYIIAVSEGNSSMCEKIKNPGLKNYCLKYVGISNLSQNEKSKERAYLWYHVGTWDGNRVTDFGYVDDGKIYVVGKDSVTGRKYKFNYALRIPVKVPKLKIDPEEFINLAEKRVKEKDKSARFIHMNYLNPEVTNLYFNKKIPTIEVMFNGKNKGYLLLYDTKLNEIKFIEKNFSNHPLCKTTAASIETGKCIPEFNIQCLIPYSEDIQLHWASALWWIRNNTLPNSRILSWWDYYSAIRLLAKRESVPSSTNTDEIEDVAKFLMYIEDEDEALKLAKKYNVSYVVIDYLMLPKSYAIHFIATSNPIKEGEKTGYGICYFSPMKSKLTPKLEKTDKGLVSRRYIVFECSIAGNPRDYIAAIVFQITNDKLTDIKVSRVDAKNRKILTDKLISWKSYQAKTNASILGVQSLEAILTNAINYEENPEAHISRLISPAYNTLVYVPAKFNNYMLTRLYLCDYLDEYKAYGLANPSIKKLKHFKLVTGFKGDLESATQGEDLSNLGYVRVYKILYNETLE